MLTPNIDEKGRRARARGGWIFLSMALITAALLPRPWTWSAGAIPVGLALAGLFMLFEARRSWCALRACGIKTPL